MLNSMSSESYQLDRVGSNMISIKVIGVGNSISITQKQISELIEMLDKATIEFY